MERELEEFCNTIDTLKVTERKRRVEQTREKLQNESVIQLLNRNTSSSSKRNITWDNVLVASHKALKAEADRVIQEERKKGNKISKAVGKDNAHYSALVIAVAAKANSGSVPMLSCNVVLSCVNSVLDTTNYRKLFGSTYIQILQQHVLPIPLYWGEITSQEWNDLFELSVLLCNKPPPGCTKDSVVTVLESVIRHGSDHSHLALRVKNRFPSVVETMRGDGAAAVSVRQQENMLRLALTVCQKLGKESRKAVCKFGEENLDFFLNMYENRPDDQSRKKHLLFELLDLQVKAHHPAGAPRKSGAAFACSWPAWKQRLAAVHCLVEKELYNLRWSLRLTDHRLDKRFVSLAVDVMKQAYSEGGLIGDTEKMSVTVATIAMDDTALCSEPNPKRRCVQINITALLMQLASYSKPVEMWPWLAVLSEFASAYPEVFAECCDITSVLRFLSRQMSSQKDPVVVGHLCRLCLSILKVEEHVKAIKDADSERLRLWQNIKEMTLRSLELNRYDANTRKLVEAFFRSDGEIASRAALLFNARTMRLNSPNVEMLVELCRATALHDRLGGENCKLLLNWLLPDKEEVQIKNWESQNRLTPADRVAEAAVAVVMRSRLLSVRTAGGEGTACDGEGEGDEEEEEAVESIYITNSFERDSPPPGCAAEQSLAGRGTEGEFKTDRVGAGWTEAGGGRLLELVSRDTALLSEKKTDETESFCSVLFHHTLFLVGLADLMHAYTFTGRKRLLDELTRVLDKLESELEQLFVQDQSEARWHSEFIGWLDKIGSRLNESSGEVARPFHGHAVTKLFLKCLWRIIKPPENVRTESGNTPVDDPLGVLLLSKENRLRVAAVGALAQFICPAVGTRLLPDLEVLQQFWDQLSEMDIKEPHVLQMNLTLLSRMSELCRGGSGEEIIELMLYRLQAICKCWYKVSRVTIFLLQLLQDLAVHVHSNGGSGASNTRKLLVFVKAIYKQVNAESYGARVTGRFVRMLESFLKVDCTGEWARLDMDEDTFEKAPVSLSAFKFLSNPFHEVRLSAANLMSLFFSTLPKSTEEKHFFEAAFKKMASSVKEAFIIEGELSEEEGADEGVNRTVSALHALANVLTASGGRFRYEALAALVATMHEKKLNAGLVQKVIALAGRRLGLKEPVRLVEESLSPLLWDWLEDGNDLVQFPWQLLNCSTEEEFYRKYYGTAVPILLMREDLQTFDAVAAKLSKTQSDLLQASFSSLMSFLLPALAEKSDTGKKVYGFAIGLIGAAGFDRLLLARLTEVVVAVARALHDPADASDLLRVPALLLPEPHRRCAVTRAPLESSLRLIQRTLDEEERSLVVFLAEKEPSVVQKVLLQLITDVRDAFSLQNSLAALHRYTVLSDVLCAGMDVPLRSAEEGMPVFVASAVVRDLLHTVAAASDDRLLSAALLHLERFVARCLRLPPSAAVIDSLLGHIVTALVMLAKTRPQDIRERSISILKMMMVDNGELLPGIARLDPLPDDPVFAPMLKTYWEVRNGNDSSGLEPLAKDVEHFLEAGRFQPNDSCRAEGLRYLKAQLSAKKSELKAMYGELHSTRGFSEDCVLHRLICMLVGLASSGDAEVAMDAARCLGELGPADLTTLVLQAESSETAGALEELAQQMAGTLAELLVDAHVPVARAASASLYAFVRTRAGFAAVGSLDDLKRNTLTPFFKSTVDVEPDTAVADESVDRAELAAAFRLVCPDVRMAHTDWIGRLTTALLRPFPRHSYLHSLISICKIKTPFAEGMLLYITRLIFLTEDEDEPVCRRAVVESVRNFLEVHFKSEGTDQNCERGTESNIYTDRASVRCILDVASTVHRYQSDNHDGGNRQRKRRRKKGDSGLDYLHVAKAAQYCSAYFTSLYFAELWYYTKYGVDGEAAEFEASGSGSSLEFLAQKDPDEFTVLQQILFEAYKRIGEPDAVYGCGPAELSDPEARIEHYRLEGRWDRIMETYDLQFSQGGAPRPAGLAVALCRLGLHHLNSVYTKEAAAGGGALADAQYESAWRLGEWSLAEQAADASTSAPASYHGLLYTALRAVHYGDGRTAALAVENARRLVVGSLRHASLEAAHSVYPPLARLQALQEIEAFEKAETLAESVSRWQLQDELGWNRFEYVEPIFAQRRLMGRRHGGDDSAQVCIGAARIALSEGDLPSATRSLHFALSGSASLQLNIVTQITMQLDQARISWARGDVQVGRCLLRSLLNQLKSVTSVELRSVLSEALRTYGTWMADTKSETGQHIIKAYFFPALDAAPKSDVEQRVAAMSCVARHSDHDYQAVSRYTKSADFQKKIEKANKAGAYAAALKGGVTKAQRKASSLLRMQSKLDESEIDTLLGRRNDTLLQSVRFYLKCLLTGESEDVQVFRVVSLWLDNKEHQELAEILGRYLGRIPSHKFLPVLPQLAAHIADPTDAFSNMLSSIFERCGSEHPHHTLPLIFALANAQRDTRDVDTTNPKKAKEPRVVAAKGLLRKIMEKGSAALAHILAGMERLADAYIHLANLTAPEKTIGKVALQRTQPIMKLGRLPQVMVTTLNTPYSKSGNYDHIVGIHSFKGHYELIGGVNAPKKIVCIGTDGIEWNQMAKFDDDVRQDAVMQQVFTIMNSILQKKKRTKQRKLFIRTYKVVQMSQRSGVIEFCDNTTLLGYYLMGDKRTKGAHERCRPDDLPPVACREKLAAVQKEPALEKKLAVYNEICTEIFPVMHNYFIEKFSTPGMWFEKRLAYTHSVASTSMIGYILGIGDRHVTNILIDNGTAELIHIDFGIAFELGKNLPTPETVPFRLTRDIIDGMGISGVEGVFRRCCEETMLVLRETRETLMTILEVLLYDPLYTWTIIPKKAISRQMKSLASASSSSSASASESSSPGSCGSQNTQDSSPTEVNEWAERVLTRLKQKLLGMEEGSGGSVTSVEGQVQWLVQEARDPANLCCIFNGWQPYL